MRISDWSSDVCSSDLDNEVRDRSAALAGSDGRQRDERRLEAGPQACVDVAVDLGDDRIAAHFGQKLAHQAAVFPCRRVGGDLFDPAENCVTVARSEEHTSELQSLMRNSYAVFCLKKKNKL